MSNLAVIHNSANGSDAFVPMSQLVSRDLSDLNVRVLDAEERDQLFLNLIVANIRATRNQQEHIGGLTSRLEDAQEQTRELQNTIRQQQRTVTQQQNDLDEICALTNAQALANLNSAIGETCCPDKELVWKKRVVVAILQVNPSARPNEVEQAFLINQHTRQQLREYLNEYRRPCNLIGPSVVSFFSQRKQTLIKYAKLLLNNNPLSSWEELVPLITNAAAKLNEGHYDPHYGYMIRSVDMILKPNAAQMLFDNPNIPSDHLWTELNPIPEGSMRIQDPADWAFSTDYTYYVRIDQDEFGL